MRVGVIGGTGFGLADPSGPSAPAWPASPAWTLDVETPYGEVPVGWAAEAGVAWLLVARHREGHAVPPHRVPYRANLEALARARADRVLAVNAVGGLDEDLPPGSFVVPDDYLDLSDRTERTFFEATAVHVDVAEAYCPESRAALLAACEAEGLPLRAGGVYAAMPGPRLETRAEVAMLRRLGALVVGMTGCPEAALARERGLCYASLCVVTNAATGVGSPVTATEIRRRAAAARPQVARVLARAATLLPRAKACRCGDALAGSRLS